MIGRVFLFPGQMGLPAVLLVRQSLKILNDSTCPAWNPLLPEFAGSGSGFPFF